ncbi:TrbI/VirB10 family protein [Brevundimonas sp.]|uniref:TrbI/VirB10 family protein n=1 Tax=Brevundimonas sp. TaxID=1871086 RepID=UPI00289985E7|nr:TrbI/VirB10 family protein [Brevundimonas sp.]
MIDLSGRDEPGVPPKAPPPGLDGRAPRPRVVRLRGGMVKAVAGGGCVLLAGALAWAFVVQPEMRAAARMRAVEARDEPARRSVRPSEVVTGQPASYDRLPPPRGETARSAIAEAPSPSSPGPRGAGYSVPASRPARPDVGTMALASALMFEPGGTAASPFPAAHPTTASATVVAAQTRDPGRSGLAAPTSPFVLQAGTLVPAVLLTGVDTSRPGPVVAAVTQNLYDTVTGRHLLAPQGSRLIGRHDGDSAYGDRRAFLVWERLILPNGKSIPLEAEPGVDARGAVGLEGRADRRLSALIVGTLFAGAITTLGQMARDNGGPGGSFLGDAGDAAAIEAARTGGRLVDRELEVRPAIRIAPGARVQALVTRDLVLEPFKP